MRQFLLVITTITLTGLVGSGASRLLGQSAASQATAPQSLKAMEAAGIKMSFGVASVKPNNSGDPGSRNSNNIGGLYRGAPYYHTGGLFSATNTALERYIMFAYDLEGYQMLRLLSQSPKWIFTNGYDIQAKAEGNPTRAQMQLMMQSLLADRFKLVVHTETKEFPVYTLVLLEPGKTGLQLQPDNEPCSTESTPPASGAPPQPPAEPAAKFPVDCGLTRMVPSAPGDVRIGGRYVTVESFAEWLTGPPGTEMDRKVVDRTGLTGTYDVSLEYSPGPNPDRPYDPVPTGSPILEAVEEQLGMKLQATRAPLDVLVIDHVEEPTPN